MSDKAILSELESTFVGLGATADNVKTLTTCLSQVHQESASLGEKLVKALFSVALQLGQTGGQKEHSEDTFETLRSIKDVSCAQPRGKFELHFCKDDLRFVKAKTQHVIPYAQIEHVYILDGMPEERKGKAYLLIHFKAPFTLKNGKSTLRCITIETKENSSALDVPSITPSQPNLKGPPVVVICGLLGQMNIKNIKAPDGKVFKNVSGTFSIPALKKFSQGRLFPMDKELVYLGTPSFVLKHSDFYAIDLPGAGGERRTFDMAIYNKGGDLLEELSQLELRDLPAWSDYMARCRLNLSAGFADTDEDDEETDKPAADAAVGADGDEDDDEEDEDFCPNSRPVKRSRDPATDGNALDGAAAEHGDAAGTSKVRRKHVSADVKSTPDDDSDEDDEDAAGSGDDSSGDEDSDGGYSCEEFEEDAPAEHELKQIIGGKDTDKKVTRSAAKAAKDV